MNANSNNRNQSNDSANNIADIYLRNQPTPDYMLNPPSLADRDSEVDYENLWLEAAARESEASK